MTFLWRLWHALTRRTRKAPIRVLGIGQDVLAPLPDGTRNYRRRVSACGVYEEID